MAVEESGNGYFVTADLFRDGFEAKVLLLLGLKQSRRRWGKSGDQILLLRFSSQFGCVFTDDAFYVPEEWQLGAETS